MAATGQPVHTSQSLYLDASGSFVFETPPEAVFHDGECLADVCENRLTHRHPPRQRTLLISDHWNSLEPYWPAAQGPLVEIRYRFEARREGDTGAGSVELRPLVRQDSVDYVAVEAAAAASLWQSYELVFRSSELAGEPRFGPQATPIEVGLRFTTAAGDSFEYDTEDVAVTVRNLRAIFVRQASPPLFSFARVCLSAPCGSGPVRDPQSGEWHMLREIKGAYPSGYHFDVTVERSVPVAALNRAGGRMVLGLERTPVGRFTIPLGKNKTKESVSFPSDLLEVQRLPLQLGDLEGGVAGVPSRVLLTTIKTATSRDDPSPNGESVCIACLGCRVAALLAGQDPDRECQPCLPTGSPPLAARGAGAQGLEALRRFRDGWMKATDAGRYYAALYATLSPALGEVILNHPKIVFDVVAAQPAWIDGLEALTDGRGSERRISRAMVWSLLGILDSFATHGSASLRRTLEFERERLQLVTLAGANMEQFWDRVAAAGGATPCTPAATRLCLQGRYQVETDWQGPNGERGAGQAVQLTPDTGYFWFFDPANVETVVKVLDGCGVNGKRWVFSAGLTDVQVHTTVTDTWTGEGKRYENAQGEAFAPLQDTSFQECRQVSPPAASVDSEWSTVVGGGSTTAAAPVPAPAHACGGSPIALCLQGGRFRVEATWQTANGQRAAGQAVALTADTGYFWFFDSANVEAVVKVLDGCTLNDRFWVFAAGLTDVRVEITVTDTHSGESKTYTNPQGRAFRPIQDTQALAGCS